MEKKDFTITISLGKPCEAVYKALTEDVTKWWGGNDLSGSTTKQGDEFVVHHPGAHYSKQRVTELIPCKKVEWLVRESELSWLKDKDEWTNTKMIFELTAMAITLCFASHTKPLCRKRNAMTDGQTMAGAQSSKTIYTAL